MLFNSYIFVFIMLPLSVIGYHCLNRIKRYNLALLFLLGMSLWFIGYMNIMYPIVLIPSVLVNYYIARMINLQGDNSVACRRLLLGIGVSLDVVILLVFKYMNFFIGSINKGLSLDVPTVKLILPLGISFYTFQQISYLVDCYREKNLNYNLLLYANYICFFPQFTQGPIVLQNEFIPQLLDENRKEIDYDKMAKGLYRFVLGLSKKVLVADNIALIVDGGYSAVDSLNGITSLVVILSYSLQIYFDFSGYSDMAIGIANLFGLDLPENFDSPYKARSIDEFWDRWHITLTRFFTRYVYIPLGGNRKGRARTYANIFFVFLLSGLWHGAEWSFVLWGIMHGIAMIISRLLSEVIKRIPTVVSTIVTFIYVSLAWVFFRATDIHQGAMLLRQIFIGGFWGLDEVVTDELESTVEGSIACRLDILDINDRCPGMLTLIFVLIITMICFRCHNTKEITNNWKASRKSGIIVVVLAIWCILSFSNVAHYIYWDF